jgi:hypothetical protein
MYYRNNVHGLFKVFGAGLGEFKILIYNKTDINPNDWWLLVHLFAWIVSIKIFNWELYRQYWAISNVICSLWSLRHLINIITIGLFFLRLWIPQCNNVSWDLFNIIFIVKEKEYKGCNLGNKKANLCLNLYLRKIATVLGFVYYWRSHIQEWIKMG